jgi:glutaryl-CoA dehydrogenase
MLYKINTLSEWSGSKSYYNFVSYYSANIHMKDVFVPEINRLEKAKDFLSGANQVLEHSRILISWNACGLAAGAYEAALDYCLKRK